MNLFYDSRNGQVFMSEQIKILRVEHSRLDFDTVVSLEKDLMKIMREAPKAILVDLQNVIFADSRSIGLFIGYKIQTDAKKIAFGLFNITEEVQYILRVTAVDTALNCYETEQEAIEEIKELIDEE